MVMTEGETYYALMFRDGIVAGEFASRLGDFIRSPAGASFADRAAPAQVQVWIASPRRGSATSGSCCVYLSERALEAVRVVPLEAPEARRVSAAELPARRLLIVGDAETAAENAAESAARPTGTTGTTA